MGDISRHLFVASGFASLACCVLSGCAGRFPQDSFFSPVEKERDEVARSASGQYGFWHDTSLCVGCGRCIEVCRGSAPEGVLDRRWLRRYRFSTDEERTVSWSCMHCEQPACVEVCPASAVSKGDDGLVTVDGSRCIGCRYCGQACPFSVPSYTSTGMDKCDGCKKGDVELAAEPRCVEACPLGALKFGDFSQLKREAGSNARVPCAPTNPAFLIS